MCAKSKKKLRKEVSLRCRTCTLYCWYANTSFRYFLTQLFWLSLFLIWAICSDLWLQNYVQSKLKTNTSGLSASVSLSENDSHVIINHWANDFSLSPLTHQKRRFGLNPINGIMNDHFISTHILILTQFEIPVCLPVKLKENRRLENFDSRA